MLARVSDRACDKHGVRGKSPNGIELSPSLDIYCFESRLLPSVGLAIVSPRTSKLKQDFYPFKLSNNERFRNTCPRRGHGRVSGDDSNLASIVMAVGNAAGTNLLFFPAPW